MGELYERILGVHPTKPKISTDLMQACMRLLRAGVVSVAECDVLFGNHYGAALGVDATGPLAGRVEAQDLLATIPTGATTANRLDRIERASLIEAVFVVADLAQDPAKADQVLNTPAKLRTALGVPDRS